MVSTKRERTRLSQQVKKRRKLANHASPLVLIPTGSTLLNLACSDSTKGGFGAGKMVNIIGDQSSGKTLLALTMFAEATKQQQFEGYRFIYDEPEQALEFDMERLFGQSVANRIEEPWKNEEGHGIPSRTIQDFRKNVLRALKRETSFLYVLDSFDALSSEEETERGEHILSGRNISGSYGTEKAKISGEIFRQIVGKLKQTNSLLVVISQTREDINPLSFKKKRRSGGQALYFYCSHEIWLAVVEQKKSKGRMIGITTRAKITKNKITGKIREVSFPIFYDYGLDDIGSSIDFLIQEGEWKKVGRKLKAQPFGTMMKTDLIKLIEQQGREKELKKLVGQTWRDVEKGLELGRKKKYE